MQQVFTWPNVRGQDKSLPSPSFEALEQEARRNGFAKGHAEGLQQGLAEGRRQAAEESAAMQAALVALRNSLEEASRSFDAEASQAIARFMLDAFAALVGASARLTPEVFAGLIDKARSVAGGEGSLQLVAHPDLATTLSGRFDCVIGADPGLAPGTVIACSGNHQWMASLLAEFESLLEQALAPVA